MFLKVVLPTISLMIPALYMLPVISKILNECWIKKICLLACGYWTLIKSIKNQLILFCSARKHHHAVSNIKFKIFVSDHRYICILRLIKQFHEINRSEQMVYHLNLFLSMRWYLYTMHCFTHVLVTIQLNYLVVPLKQK